MTRCRRSRGNREEEEGEEEKKKEQQLGTHPKLTPPTSSLVLDSDIDN
jgi:hypothetical protein